MLAVTSHRGFELVPGCHPLACRRCRIQLHTKTLDISPNLCPAVQKRAWVTPKDTPKRTHGTRKPANCPGHFPHTFRFFPLFLTRVAVVVDARSTTVTRAFRRRRRNTVGGSAQELQSSRISGNRKVLVISALDLRGSLTWCANVEKETCSLEK